MLVNFNGEFIAREEAHISINDSALLYGDSLFETFRAEKNHILLQKEHLDRLCLSAHLLGFPCDRNKIEDALSRMSAVLKDEVSRLRLTLGRGPVSGFFLPDGTESWFCITANRSENISDTHREAGVECVLAPNQRCNPLNHLPQMKRGNHADCLYAADFARRQKSREALFVNDDRIIEGSSSNIFALYEDRLHTPPIDNLVLAGVTRREILSAAVEYGLHITEKALPLSDLVYADEVWLSNAMIELLPVAGIAGNRLHRGTCWREILSLYKQRTET